MEHRPPRSMSPNKRRKVTSSFSDRTADRPSTSRRTSALHFTTEASPPLLHSSRPIPVPPAATETGPSLPRSSRPSPSPSMPRSSRPSSSRHSTSPASPPQSPETSLLYENVKWHPRNFPDVTAKTTGREQSTARSAIGAFVTSNKNVLKLYRIFFCGWTPQLFSAVSMEILSDIRIFLVHHGYRIPEHDPMTPIYFELAKAVWSIVQTPPGCPKPDYSNEIKAMKDKYGDRWILRSPTFEEKEKERRRGAPSSIVMMSERKSSVQRPLTTTPTPRPRDDMPFDDTKRQGPTILKAEPITNIKDWYGFPSMSSPSPVKERNDIWRGGLLSPRDSEIVRSRSPRPYSHVDPPYTRFVPRMTGAMPSEMTGAMPSGRTGAMSYEDPPMPSKPHHPVLRRSVVPPPTPKISIAPAHPPPKVSITPAYPPPKVSIAPTHLASWQSIPPPPTTSSHGPPTIMYKLHSVTARDPVKYAKASDSLNKLYGANPKLQFSGRPTESFDRLFKRFVRELGYCGITEDQDASSLLPKMLNGPALTFYERYLEARSLTLHEACTFLKRQFHTAERAMHLRQTWEILTLEKTLMTMIRKGQNPSLREAFNEFVKELQEVQEDLPHEVSDDNELHIRILRAIRPYKECQSVANNPPPSSTGLILAVNSAIDQAMAVTTSLRDLMARARAISPNPMPFDPLYTNRVLVDAYGIPVEQNPADVRVDSIPGRL